VAILIRKAEAEAAQMPEDVAFFIAKNVRANVRELEGALRKVLAYSRFSPTAPKRASSICTPSSSSPTW